MQNFLRISRWQQQSIKISMGPFKRGVLWDGTEFIPLKLALVFSLNCTPLQFSCLENPMDGGAWLGCSLWGRSESETTERLHFHFSLSCIGEGNGNPLQCSCLENPRDGEAWWAAVYGVAQSQTWLKWLSSSSSHYSNCPDTGVQTGAWERPCLNLIIVQPCGVESEGKLTVPIGVVHHLSTYLWAGEKYFFLAPEDWI